MASPTSPTLPPALPPETARQGPAAPPGQPSAPGQERRSVRWGAAADRALAAVELALAAAALAGSGVFVATSLFGRTALFFPSAAWLLAAVSTWLVAGGHWWVAARLADGTAQERFRRAAWPALALLPATAAVVAVYADDASHHLAWSYLPGRQSLFWYAVALYAGASAVFWTTTAARRLRRPRWPAATWTRGGTVFLLALAAAAYARAALVGLPAQPDLSVNLAGARVLLAGGLPYQDSVPVWADRVHLLPATLLLVFGPLTLLPAPAARLLFFVVNQLLWLAAAAVFVRRLVAPPLRGLWIAAALAFGALYWPWQEAVRFGQQDGLLLLLFVLSITAAAAGDGGRAGIPLGLAMVVKPLSIWLPLVYAAHGRWRTLLAAGITAGAVVLASLPFTGIEPWWHLARVEVPAMLPGTVRGTNIPLPSLHARMFVGREQLADGEPAPTVPVIGALNAATSVLGLLLAAHLIRRRDGRRRTWLLDASIGLTLTLLLAPMAWQHYASWLMIAFGVLGLPVVWQPLSRAAQLAVAGLASGACFLLSLDDSRMMELLEPVVQRWPAVLAFYTAGLAALLLALLVARFNGPAAAREAAGEPGG